MAVLSYLRHLITGTSYHREQISPKQKAYPVSRIKGSFFATMGSRCGKTNGRRIMVFIWSYQRVGKAALNKEMQIAGILIQAICWYRRVEERNENGNF